MNGIERAACGRRLLGRGRPPRLAALCCAGLLAASAALLAGCGAAGTSLGSYVGETDTVEVLVEDEPSEVDGDESAASPSDTSVAADSVSDKRAELEELGVIALDMDLIPEADGCVTAFSLVGDEAPALFEEEYALIEDAISEVELLGDVSVVLVNCDTGAGIAYDSDAFVYGASSFKGPYAAYFCSELVDAGLVSLDSLCAIPDALELEGSTWQHGRSYYVGDLLEATVLYSDNDAYKTLHRNYDSLGYSSWVLGELGEGSVECETDYYHFTSARTMAKAWAYTWDYLCSGSDTAAWLGSLLSGTNVSPIRDALEGWGAVVYNKAGWYAGSYDYNSTSDAGIVQVGDATYLVAVLTSCPYGGVSVSAVEGLVLSLFAVSDALA